MCFAMCSGKLVDSKNFVYYNSIHVEDGRAVLVGWVLLSAVSVSCGSGLGRTHSAEEPGLGQQIIFLIFSLNCWFSRAYTNGLTAELNRIITSAMASRMAPMSSGMKYSKTYMSWPIPQQIPNMTVTATTIKVTRLRTFTTPCVLRHVKYY